MNATCRANTALRGGVVYLGGGASVTVNNSWFDANSANFGGNYFIDANVSLTFAVFELANPRRRV